MNQLDPLEHRRIGRTDMVVTAVSLGGAGLGGIFGPVGDADGVAAVEKAFELGINYLDTSPKYGEAERRMGMALRGVPRDSYYISSKVGTHPSRQPGDYSADAARWTVDNSLKVLGVDHLDLCHLHEPEPHNLDQALGPGGALEALVELKTQGVIRAIGIGVQDHELHRRMIETGKSDVSMMVNDYTLMRQYVDDVFALAETRRRARQRRRPRHGPPLRPRPRHHRDTEVDAAGDRSRRCQAGPRVVRGARHPRPRARPAVQHPPAGFRLHVDRRVDCGGSRGVLRGGPTGAPRVRVDRASRAARRGPRARGRGHPVRGQEGLAGSSSRGFGRRNGPTGRLPGGFIP